LRSGGLELLEQISQVVLDQDATDFEENTWTQKWIRPETLFELIQV